MPPRLPRRLAALIAAAAGLIAFAVAADPSAGPTIPPKTFTWSKPDATLADTLRELTKQTGIPVEASGVNASAPCPASFSGVPFWEALDQVAAKTGTRVAAGKHGREVILAKRTGPAAPAGVDGPFRVAVRQVQPRTDFETGQTFTEVTLDVRWEPRFPVFRIDSEPTISALADDKGSKLDAVTSRAKTPPTGFLYTTTVRVEGVPRSATKLTRLAGSFTVTASERMLPFVFDDLTRLPASPPPQEGVTATLKRFEKVDNRWEAEVELVYPPGQPVFESFESWVTENRARLVAPNKARTFETADFEVPEQGRRVVAVYRFAENPAKGLMPGDRKGWSLVYETPAPLVEFPVRFELKDIPLP